LTPACLAVSSSSPTYKYTISSNGVDSGSRVHWTSGTTNYWDCGKLDIIPRTDDASLDLYLTWGGTTMSKITDGATEITNQALQAAAGTDVTLATDDEDFKVLIDIDTTNLAYGVPMYTVSALGKLEERLTAIMIFTNCTTVSVGHLEDGGWKVIDHPGLTSARGFYKMLDLTSNIPASGQKMSYTVTIPFDVSASGAAGYDLSVSLNDDQLESNVAIGAPTTTIPTVYGGIVGYGIAAINCDEVPAIAAGIQTLASRTIYGDFTSV